VRPALVGREFTRAELTIFVPGMLWRGPTSNPIIIPRKDIMDLLPNKALEADKRRSGARG
jgi:hypothetical protein